MQHVPQIEPISRMKRDQPGVLAKLKDGPVVLAQRSKPAAVLVSLEEWEKIADELDELRRLVVEDHRSREMEADEMKRIPFDKAELIRRGLIDG